MKRELMLMHGIGALALAAAATRLSAKSDQMTVNICSTDPSEPTPRRRIEARPLNDERPTPKAKSDGLKRLLARKGRV
ncbi:MAG: hypothetical protein ACKVKF_24740 [Rhodobacterales bacterium]